jgi:adenylate kinase family enzyme
MQVVLFYGPAACGKGTHAAKLSELTNWPIIDAGKEFRTIVETENSPLSKRLKTALDSDKPVLTSDYLTVISGIVNHYVELEQSFIMDRGGALPKEAEYISHLLEKNNVKLSFIHLPLTLQESVERSSERFFVSDVNQGFASFKLALEHCSSGELPFKRNDDTSKEKIIHRYKVMYDEHKAKILSIYSQNKYCNMVEISSHHTIDESFSLIKATLSL